MNEDDRTKERASVDPADFDLKLTTRTALQSKEPWEYVTEFHGRILFQEWPEPDSVNPVDVLAGRIALTQFHLARARDYGQDPRDVFDSVSETALEFYDAIYDGRFGLRPEAVAAAGLPVGPNPSLLVIDVVELLPRFRGSGVGLITVLKAMHLLGPADGLVALQAAPLRLPVQQGADEARWQQVMKMDQFEPDSPQVRKRLGRYWARLGFEPVGLNHYLLCLQTPLPMAQDVLDDLKNNP